MTGIETVRRTVTIDFLYLDLEVCTQGGTVPPLSPLAPGDVPENLLRLFRGRERTESACCDAGQQESCCEMSQKASCCGPRKEADARACGCQ